MFTSLLDNLDDADKTKASHIALSFLADTKHRRCVSIPTKQKNVLEFYIDIGDFQYFFKFGSNNKQRIQKTNDFKGHMEVFKKDFKNLYSSIAQLDDLSFEYDEDKCLRKASTLKAAVGSFSLDIVIMDP